MIDTTVQYNIFALIFSWFALANLWLTFSIIIDLLPSNGLILFGPNDHLGLDIVRYTPPPPTHPGHRAECGHPDTLGQSIFEVDLPWFSRHTGRDEPHPSTEHH
jgi:hypothetical protein